MGRERLQPGEHGSIISKKISPNLWEASTVTRDSSGKRRIVKRRRSSKLAAQNAVKDAVEKLATPPEEPLTISQACEDWLNIRKPSTLHISPATHEASPSDGQIRLQTWESYQHVIRKFIIPTIGETEVKEFAARQAEEFLHSLINRDKGTGYWIAKHSKIVLTMVLDRAIRDGIITDNPVTRLNRLPSKITEPEIVDDHTLQLFWDAIDQWINHTPENGGHPPDLRIRDALYIMAATGLRIGEVLALRIQDIDPINHTIKVTGTIVRTRNRIFRQKMPKTRRSIREIRLPDWAWEVIEQRLKTLQPSPSGALFPTRSGTFMDPGNFRRTLRNILAKYELTGTLTPHSFRRNVATSVARELGAEAAKRALGNSQVETTVRHYIAPDRSVIEYTATLPPPQGTKSQEKPTVSFVYCMPQPVLRQ